MEKYFEKPDEKDEKELGNSKQSYKSRKFQPDYNRTLPQIKRDEIRWNEIIEKQKNEQALLKASPEFKWENWKFDNDAVPTWTFNPERKNETTFTPISKSIKKTSRKPEKKKKKSKLL